MLSRRRLLKGAVAGLLGGLAGSWLMNRFSALVYKNGGLDGQRQSMDRIATKLLAQRMSEVALGQELSRHDANAIEPWLHYALGTMTGGIYGVLAEVTPLTTKGAGTAFGTVFWIGGDEIALPVLQQGPSRSLPAAAHVEALASHFVYAVTAEAVRRGVLAVLQ
jgi:putative membrane protein